MGKKYKIYLLKYFSSQIVMCLLLASYLGKAFDLSIRSILFLWGANCIAYWILLIHETLVCFLNGNWTPKELREEND